jgi:enoyl-[acyl-carrier-protein] reductase (NADH)
VPSSVLEVSRVQHFVSRDKELERVHQELEHDRCRKTAVVHSLGRIGKTQLALAYVQQHQSEYTAVF